MSGGSADDPPPGGGQPVVRRRWWNRFTKIATGISAVVAFAAALFGLLGIPSVNTWFSSSAATTATTPMTPATPVATPALSGAEPSGPGPAVDGSNTNESGAAAGGGGTESATQTLGVGDCLSAQGQVLPCSAIHRYEVIGVPGQACEQATVVGYLGGNPELDIPRVSLSPDYDGGSCVISSADQTDWTGSVKGAFSADSHNAMADALRRCRDDRMAAQDVSCDQRHTGEYVGVPAGTVPGQSECVNLAAGYLNINFDRVAAELAVQALPTSDPDDGRPRCVVVVRGNNDLTASLRNVRTKELPISPP